VVLFLLQLIIDEMWGSMTGYYRIENSFRFLGQNSRFFNYEVPVFILSYSGAKLFKFKSIFRAQNMHTFGRFQNIFGLDQFSIIYKLQILLQISKQICQ
jgi:hypothetical protein